MSKIRKYKIGDKVIILKNLSWCKSGDIGTIIGYNNNNYIINIPNRPSISGRKSSVFECSANELEYKYEKPLNELRTKISPGSLIRGDAYYIINSFIEREETLNDDELKTCSKLWKKYNKL